MGDLISRKALKDALWEERWSFYPLMEDIDDMIDAQPAVGAAPAPRRGKWIDLRESSKDVPKCKCSKCGYERIGLETSYCPGCGAKMDLGGDN